ncbi:MAG: DUF5666 domain-containing protein [Chloroflexi bacterium]|nr:DUF5666 domain-containing protein [Chloroflexota bacterium]
MSALVSKLLGLAVGVVLVLAVFSPNGLALAQTPAIEVVDGEGGSGEDFVLSGPIEALGEGSITVWGVTFQITEQTIMDEGLLIGGVVKIEFALGEGESLIALEVETEAADDAGDEDVDEEEEDVDEVDDEEFEDFTSTGVIESINESTITINGQVFTIGENSELDEGLQVGVTATVEFITLPDGTLLIKEVETDANDDSGEDDQDGDEDEGEDEDENDRADDEDEDEDEDHDNSGPSQNSG